MMTNGLVHGACALALAIFPLAAALPAMAADDVRLGDIPLVDLTRADGSLGAMATDLEVCDVAFGDGAYGAGYWFAGVEATFLSFDATTGGVATMSVDDTDTAGTDLRLEGSQGLLDAFGYAPRVWLGRRIGEQWGVVGRFWWLSKSAVEAPTVPAGAVNLTNFLTTSNVSQAQLYTADLEAVRTFTPGGWKIDGTGGVRHASLDTRSELSAFGVFTSGNFMILGLSNGAQFNGTGLTGSLTARRQIGTSPWSLFISGRGSQLWGYTDSFARVDGTVANPPDTPLLGAATVRRSNGQATATIAELQVGAQCDFPLGHWPVQAFFRTALEYQHWVIDGLPTGGAGFGGTIDDVQVNSFVSAGLPDAQLIGLVISTGFYW